MARVSVANRIAFLALLLTFIGLLVTTLLTIAGLIPNYYETFFAKHEVQVSFQVLNKETFSPVKDAKIEVDGAYGLTNVDGIFTFRFQDRKELDVAVEKPSFFAYNRKFSLDSLGTTIQILLNPNPVYERIIIDGSK